MVEIPTFTLPFDAKEVTISQGFHGPWSHKEMSKWLDLSFALDFIVPLETPVLASKEGRIVYSWFNSVIFYDGIDPEIGNNLPPLSTNFVAILHADKSISYYSHLDATSSKLKLKIGELVPQHEVIGLTGKSGWIGPKPHLHFMVCRPNGKTINFKLSDYALPLEHSQLDRKMG